MDNTPEDIRKQFTMDRLHDLYINGDDVMTVDGSYSLPLKELEADRHLRDVLNALKDITETEHLIAEKVMGWHLVNDEWANEQGEITWHVSMFKPISGKGSSAVMNKLLECFPSYSMNKGHSRYDLDREHTFAFSATKSVNGYGRSEATAICHAALQSIGVARPSWLA